MIQAVKWRYIVFTVDANLEAARREVYNCVKNFIGVLGAADAYVSVIDDCWDSEKHMGIIRCSSKALDAVKAALAFGALRVKTLLVTGTIKKGKTFIRQYKR